MHFESLLDVRSAINILEITMAGKFFTAELIDKWDEGGVRGRGVLKEYQPWHQITRGDPASWGRSHLTYCPILSRMRHQLSDGEQTILGFCLMVPGIIDIREQFKLELYGHICEVSNYSINRNFYINIGTVDIAKDLKIKHPKVSGKSGASNWVMTSDFVLTISYKYHFETLAVAFKLHADLKKRTRDKLRIEQKYWELEQSSWLLITEQKFSRLVGDTVRRALPWVLHPEQVSDDLKLHCSLLKEKVEGKTFTQALRIIETNLLVDTYYSPLIFWQTVWSGMLFLDLSMLKFSSEKINILTEKEFWEQNPIVSRRSACL